MKIAVVHETPILSGLHYKVLEGTLAAHGCDEFEVFALGKQGAKFTTSGAWLPWHEEVYCAGKLKRFDKILACGGVALAACLGASKTLAITRYRGRGYKTDQGHYLVPTLSPTTVIKEVDYFRDFVQDIAKLIANDDVLPDNNAYDNDLEVDSWARLMEMAKGSSFLAADIETKGFAYMKDGDELLSLGLCALMPDDSAYGVCFTEKFLKRNRARVTKFLESYKGALVFHNLRFDLAHLSQYAGRELHLKNPKDTMLMHYALDERPANRFKVHGLKMLSRVHFDAPDYELMMPTWLKEYFESLEVGDKVKMNDLLQHLYVYQFQDTWYTARLYDLFKREIEEDDFADDLIRLLDAHLIPATCAIAESERKGAFIDYRYYEKMLKRVEKSLAEDLVTLKEQCLEIADMADFNPNSPKQVKAIVYEHFGMELPDGRGVGRYAWKHKKGDQSTDKDVLKVLAKIARDDGETMISDIIMSILNYRQRSKVLGTYVKGILSRAEQRDEDVKGYARVRTSLFIPGTATGRLSSANPNLQNIPDASHVGEDVRSGFRARPGYKILEADYSQLELRVAGLFSEDPMLLQTYRDDRDIHQEVAYQLWNKPKEEVTKYERYLAKCLNFGVLYGRGPRSIATGPEMEHLEELGGARWTSKDIEKYFKKFLAGYPKLVEWMDGQKEFVRDHNYVSTPFGNYRRFDLVLPGEWPRVERQAVNTPIQGFASHMCLSALWRIHRALDPTDGHIWFPVHDSIMLEVREEAIPRVAFLVVSTMEQDLPTLPGIDWNLLPFKAEAEVKERWGGKGTSVDVDVQSRLVTIGRKKYNLAHGGKGSRPRARVSRGRA